MLYSILYSHGQINFTQIIMQLLASLLVILIILPLHEMAHGYVAYKLGDDTAKRSGRLTLNPMAHLNYAGALCLILIGFGWAEPVPVNARNLKHPKKDMAIVALAGPVSNILAAIVGALLYNAAITFISNVQVLLVISYFLAYYISVNIGLAIFNLIPLPPLDGSKILGAFLSNKNYTKMLVYERQLSIVLILLVATGIVDKIVMFPRDWLETFVMFVGSLPFLPFT